MIVASSFREPGGLASHLLRTDSNESVRLLESLCRNAPLDVHRALRTFAAISATNLRATNAYVHIVIAPAAELVNGQRERILDLIDEVYSIRPDHPRIIVAHEKGARPVHYHVVLPLVHPGTGRAIKSSKNHFHDELVARIAGKEFSHPAVIGRYQAEVAATPHGRAAGLRPPKSDSPPLHRQLFNKTDRQQMSRVGATVAQLEKRIQQVWAASGGQISRLITCLPQHGLLLAEGRAALLLIDGVTGAEVAAARTLRRLAKEQGAPVTINDAMIRTALRGCSLPPLAELQRAIVARNYEHEMKAVEAEQRLARREQETDDSTPPYDEWFLELARKAQALKEAKATLTARRAAIREAHALCRELRWARVDRAFAAARWTDNKLVRKFAFRAAAAGVLLCGGSLGLALVAGGIAVSLLPTLERARAMSRAAQIANTADRATMIQQLAQVYDEFTAAKLGNDPQAAIARRLDDLGRGAEPARQPAQEKSQNARAVLPAEQGKSPRPAVGPDTPNLAASTVLSTTNRRPAVPVRPEKGGMER